LSARHAPMWAIGITGRQRYLLPFRLPSCCDGRSIYSMGRRKRGGLSRLGDAGHDTRGHPKLAEPSVDHIDCAMRLDFTDALSSFLAITRPARALYFICKQTNTNK